MRYIVYERPVGLKCWTIAHKESGLAGEFGNKENAEKFAEETRKTMRYIKVWDKEVPTETFIAEIELPA
jgi:hypothetical protein